MIFHAVVYYRNPNTFTFSYCPSWFHVNVNSRYPSGLPRVFQIILMPKEWVVGSFLMLT